MDITLLENISLETRRLHLRHVQEADAEDAFAFLSDPIGCHFDGFEAFTEMDGEFFRLIKRFASQKTRYAIVLKETGNVIGVVNLTPDDSRAVDAVEIGYQISPACRRMGYGSEAIAALIPVVFAADVDMILAGIMVENTPSEAMLRKLGFQSEGIHHKALPHDVLGPTDLHYFYLDKP